ncbi:MAG: hypothetical protein RLZZ26_95 [Candidatus Parcubacteria bacterium]|jgi:DNA repair protein RadC
MEIPTSIQSDSELVAVLIGKVAAKRWYRGSLGELFQGEALPSRARQKFAAAHELVRRWMHEDLRHGPALDSPGATGRFLLVHYANKEREVFMCLFLDNRHRLISADEMFMGTIDGASVHPREVVKRALQLNAAAVILAHNHPSGVCDPSQADQLITTRLREALALVDIRCLDHMIVAGGAVISFAEKGLL